MKKVSIDVTGKNVLIIGGPASGKTYVANLLAKSNTHTLIHTDDYQAHGYQQALYVMMKDIKKIRGCTIIEGVQGYRLLRKGLQFDCYYPDLVIELEVSHDRMVQTYMEERKGKDISSLRAFAKRNQTILNDYLNMTNKRKPLWIKLKNHY